MKVQCVFCELRTEMLAWLGGCGGSACMCPGPTFQLLNHLTDFHETWYKHCAISGYLSALIN